MFDNMSKKEAQDHILELVKEYCDKYHNIQGEYKPGDRISYAGRVYDSDEMINLVDSSLEFWLTGGRYTRQFEREFGK